MFFEQGLGKTWVTAGVIERMCSSSRQSFLVVVPLANIETTWVRVLNLIDNDGEDGPVICRTLDSFRKVKDSKILLVHYEALPRIVDKIVKVDWSLVVYDESQRLKSRGTKQSRIARRLRYARKRLVLSGTPIEQSPQDLWAQMRFACPDVLGDRWADFDSTWLRPTGYMGYKRKFIASKLPRFLRLISPHILRLTKDEVLDLPPMTVIPTPVVLRGRQRRLYRDLEREMIATEGEDTITSDLAITQLIRLHQICGGFIRWDDGRTDIAGRAKFRALRRIVRREPTPVVVFCRYVEEVVSLFVWASQSGFRARSFYGQVKQRDRVRILEEFQRGEVDVLICQIRTGGVGIDLYRACTCVVYSSTWSYIDVEQAVTRLHRIGQTRPVKVFLLFATNTVDSDIVEALHSKRTVSESVLTNAIHRRNKMAKKNKKVDAPPPTPPPVKTKRVQHDDDELEAEEAPTFKYGVKDLAEKLGTKPTSVRVRLRSLGIPKVGKSYGWNSKDELQAVIDKIKSTSRRKDDDDDDDDDDEDDE